MSLSFMLFHALLSRISVRRACTDGKNVFSFFLLVYLLHIAQLVQSRSHIRKEKSHVWQSDYSMAIIRAIIRIEVVDSTRVFLKFRNKFSHTRV